MCWFVAAVKVKSQLLNVNLKHSLRRLIVLTRQQILSGMIDTLNIQKQTIILSLPGIGIRQYRLCSDPHIIGKRNQQFFWLRIVAT